VSLVEDYDLIQYMTKTLPSMPIQGNNYPQNSKGIRKALNSFSLPVTYAFIQLTFQSCNSYSSSHPWKEQGVKKNPGEPQQTIDASQQPAKNTENLTHYTRNYQET